MQAGISQKVARHLQASHSHNGTYKRHYFGNGWAMFRYKQLLSLKLSLRSYNGQVGKILAGVKVMNKVIGLGIPVRQPVS